MNNKQQEVKMEEAPENLLEKDEIEEEPKKRKGFKNIFRNLFSKN